jgi:hypothetical protein
MNRIMVNLAKVDKDQIARETGLPSQDVDKVLEQIIVIKQARSQPRPVIPEGAITLGAASRKYKVHSRTISRWVQQHYIPVLLRTKNALYIDEVKLVEVVRLYKASPGQGKKTVAQAIRRRQQ